MILVSLLIEQVRTPWLYSHNRLHCVGAVLTRCDPPAAPGEHLDVRTASRLPLPARALCTPSDLTPPASAKVLCQGGQLLRRGASAAGQRAGRRRVPARGRLPRVQRHVRRAAKPVFHRRSHAGLPERPAGACCAAQDACCFLRLRADASHCAVRRTGPAPPSPTTTTAWTASSSASSRSPSVCRAPAASGWHG